MLSSLHSATAFTIQCVQRTGAVRSGGEAVIIFFNKIFSQFVFGPLSQAMIIFTALASPAKSALKNRINAVHGFTGYQGHYATDVTRSYHIRVGFFLYAITKHSHIVAGRSRQNQRSAIDVKIVSPSGDCN